MVKIVIIGELPDNLVKWLTKSFPELEYSTNSSIVDETYKAFIEARSKSWKVYEDFAKMQLGD